MTAESPVLAAERRAHAADHGASDPLPPPTASGTARALSEALTEGALHDHVGAVRDYVAQRDGVTLTQDGSILTLTVADGEVLIELDSEQRIGRLAFSMNAADLPRPGFWARLFRRG